VVVILFTQLKCVTSPSRISDPVRGQKSKPYLPKQAIPYYGNRYVKSPFAQDGPAIAFDSLLMFTTLVLFLVLHPGRLVRALETGREGFELKSEDVD
jgi:hypothetical protein